MSAIKHLETLSNRSAAVFADGSIVISYWGGSPCVVTVSRGSFGPIISSMFQSRDDAGSFAAMCAADIARET